ncbi:MAG: multiprotein bridging factor aMBF1 [Halobacteriales archaeon]|nr:multiprotein bridging factor aMBF1 [Halobacteriales archaeon]
MQCEMCGAETDDPTTIQTEGTQLEVCSNCVEFGTVLHDEERKKKKKSTSSDTPSKQTTSRSPSRSSSSPSRTDPFDKMGTLAPDYDQRVRNARENAGMKQEELADELNEKLSLIRKIERGDMRPNEEVRGKLESALGVSLTEEVGGEEWESDESSGGYTVGDIIERKD